MYFLNSFTETYKFNVFYCYSISESNSIVFILCDFFVSLFITYIYKTSSLNFDSFWDNKTNCDGQTTEFLKN